MKTKEKTSPKKKWKKPAVKSELAIKETLGAPGFSSDSGMTGS
jgi:hypothetical protein